MSLDLSRCKLSPYKHQQEAIEFLLDNSYYMLALEMGMGKTMISIVAAQLLWERGDINKVVVICPASVRSVWFDEELGELAKHLFLPANVELYHRKRRSWTMPADLLKTDKPHLHWIVTNYEFIRSTKWLDELLERVDKKTLLILDESSAVKSYNAQQTKACMALRKKSGRIVLLNGTPIANSPMDMFSQGNIMHPDILECRGITHFRARYAEMGGFVVHTAWGSRPTQVVGWKNLDDLQKRFAPYVLRRLKQDCLDLPPVLPSVTLVPELTPTTWKIYKEMRDEMVSWLSNQTVSVASQTITKVLRLSQITSGFIGGLEPEVYNPEALQDGRPSWMQELDEIKEPAFPTSIETVQEIGREKLDLVLIWIENQLEVDPNLKLIVWCRFIPELRRLLRELKERYIGVMPIGSIAGQPMLGEKLRDERQKALRLLDPRTAPEGPVIVGGTYGTGSLGLNLTACHTVINMSFDYSYWKSVQTAARVDRPGQVHPISTFDVIATGPQGQKTIDHTILKAQREKANVAEWTTSAWIHALTQE